jgi:hypothetical protein
MSITATPSIANAGNEASIVAISNGTNSSFFMFNPSPYNCWFIL